METESLPTKYELNATDLQNLQNQKNIQESSTWVEWSYWYFTQGKIIKNVYELSKVVSPQHTIRQIATYTVGPLTKKIDNVIGSSNAIVNVFGYEIPCSFSTLGNLATETLTITASPAQWAAYKTANLLSNSFSSKVITKFDLKNRGVLGREAAAAIQIGSTLFCQKSLEQAEKTKIVSSTYKKVDSISKPIDTFVNKQISSGLELLGVDTTQPLGLTKTEIERKKILVASEEKVADIAEKIRELEKQETKLQEETSHQDKTDEQIHQDADRIIQEARKYEKNCPEKENMPKYKKHKKFKKVWAENISEQIASEFNISEKERMDLKDDIVRTLHNEHGEKAHNEAMKKVIVKHKAMLHDKSKTHLNDVKCAHSNMEHKLVKAKQKYNSERENFVLQSNPHQQAQYEKEQRKRNEKRQKNNSTTTSTYSGNIQFTISPEELKEELEKHINQYLEENGYSKRNLNDENNKVFINGKVSVIRDTPGYLGLVVPVKVDNKRMACNGKITQLNIDLYFDIQLDDSSPEKILNINIDATYKQIKKPFYKLFSTFQLMRVGKKANEVIQPALINAINVKQEEVDTILLKDNILSQFKEYLPQGVNMKPGIINVRPRVDSGNNQVLDIDFNADFQYEMSADILKDVFPGYSIGDYRFEKIRNIEMAGGTVKMEIPLSGAINENIITSFDLNYCPGQQRFTFNNLNVKPQNSASSLINFFSTGINCMQDALLGHLESYVNNNLENIRLLAIENVQQQLQNEIPGSLVIDPDSVTIDNINFNDNITVDFSLNSNNSTLNQISAF